MNVPYSDNIFKSETTGENVPQVHKSIAFHTTSPLDNSQELKENIPLLVPFFTKVFKYSVDNTNDHKYVISNHEAKKAINPMIFQDPFYNFSKVST